MTHYALLGNDFNNAPKLGRYFGMIGAGQSSLSSFEEAFGMDGNDLWLQELQYYNKRLFALRYDFHPDDVQYEYQQSDSDVDAVLALIDELTKRNQERLLDAQSIDGPL